MQLCRVPVLCSFLALLVFKILELTSHVCLSQAVCLSLSHAHADTHALHIFYYVTFSLSVYGNMSCAHAQAEVYSRPTCPICPKNTDN